MCLHPGSGAGFTTPAFSSWLLRSEGWLPPGRSSLATTTRLVAFSHHPPVSDLAEAGSGPMKHESSKGPKGAQGCTIGLKSDRQTNLERASFTHGGGSGGGGGGGGGVRSHQLNCLLDELRSSGHDNVWSQDPKPEVLVKCGGFCMFFSFREPSVAARTQDLLTALCNRNTRRLKRCQHSIGPFSNILSVFVP